MTLAPRTLRKATIAEYLRAEQASKEKHEYIDGEIRSMAGGTYKHSVVILNIAGELRSRLKGMPCRASDGNTRVAVANRRSCLYPNATVLCGPPEYDPQDKKQTTILNPTLVVEVLSEGTEAFDRGDKFSRYRDIPSLRE
jgi:Uma2 family endonuclease